MVLSDRYIYTAFARDTVRGCDSQWIRNLYSFAQVPTITFFFQVPLETALSRILDNRPDLKYFEAGMDMGFSPDPYESFRIFQKKINNEYLKMVKEYQFTVIDATEQIHVQQEKVREIINRKIDLPNYHWRSTR
jgi:dTMP kinase